MNAKIALFPLLALALGVNAAWAQQYVFPKNGQSQQQQQQDDYQCHQWAVQQTGFDPTRAAQQSAAAPASRDGTVARGALGGAARGYVIGSIADGDQSKAAAAGAVMGGFRSARTQSQAGQQQAAAASGSIDGYNRAKAACLEGRGYTVK
jgi:outer membrane lipoprotein SlyB